MMQSQRWSVLLAAAGLAWCVIVGLRIWITPVRYLRYSSDSPEPRFVYFSFQEVSGWGIWILVIPIILAGAALRLSWRRRTRALGAVTCAFVLFCLITGFSIGSTYMPVAGALLAATLIGIFDAPQGVKVRRSD